MRAGLALALMLAAPLGALAQSEPATGSATESESPSATEPGSAAGSDLGPRVYAEEDDGTGLGPRLFPDEEPDAAPEPRPDTVVVEPAQTGRGTDEGPDDSPERNAATASQERPGRVQLEAGKEEIWETWWFWASIGLVVIGVTLAVIVDVTTDDPASEGDPAVTGLTGPALRLRF